MKLSEEQKALLKRATERARAVLKPGDRLSARRCCDQKIHVTMSAWDGDWIVSRSGIDDIHAAHIYRLNGRPVDFRAED